MRPSDFANPSSSKATDPDRARPGVRPRVAIVLCTWQGERYLDAQLDSLARQSWPVSVHVHDDASSDRSVAIARRHPVVDVVVPHPVNVGFVGNFERAVAATLAHGFDYLALADQDDVWSPERVARTMHLMLDSERARGTAHPVLVHSDLAVVDGDGAPLHASYLDRRGYRLGTDRDLAAVLGQNGVMGNTVLVNRALARLALPFPRALHVHDWWLALLAELHGDRRFEPRPLVDYRTHSGNASNPRGSIAPSAAAILGRTSWERVRARDFRLPFLEDTRRAVLEELLAHDDRRAPATPVRPGPDRGLPELPAPRAATARAAAPDPRPPLRQRLPPAPRAGRARAAEQPSLPEAPVKPTLETRRRLYREGKRLLGPDRMRRLADGGRSGAARLRRLRGRVAGLRARLRTPPWIRVTSIVVIDARAVLVHGRLNDGGRDARGASAPCRLIVGLRGGGTRDVTGEEHRYADRRGALADDGSRAFVLALELAEGERPERLTLERDGGRAGNCPCPVPDAAAKPLARVVALLGPLADCIDAKRALLDAAIGPAVARAWASRHRSPVGSPEASSGASSGSTLHRPPGRLVRYNEALAEPAPRTTLIVPLYGRHDFVTHQLAHFAADSEMHAAEILYVLDDPRLEDGLRARASALERLHDLAFSVLYLDGNIGYAGANNAGAGHARGEDLLLLNSDVLPAASGWLGRMYASVDGRLDDHVLGARLLYDDGTVQHDGMRFEAAENFEGLWLNRHPGKGLPNALFSDATRALPREAVTGACLLVTRARYRALGGLDEDYVLGDFEDSDFCLKARRAGMAIGLAPRAVLYHLERQSQSMVTRSRWKDDLTHYNCWTHSRRWHASILELHDGERDGD